MAHGQPDYGMYQIAKTIYRLADMGELATRLGSIVTFDRRGDVVWLDDFESNINKWRIFGTGTGYSALLSSEAARSGGLSAKLVTGITASGHIYIARYLPYPVEGNVGSEFSFVNNTDLQYIILAFDCYSGLENKEGAVRYRCSDEALDIYLPTVGFTEIATGIELVAATYFFHTLKLVVDLSTNKYVRLLLDSTSYDLSAYSISTAPSVIEPMWIFEITARNRVIGNEAFYIDDVIITQNEP